MLTFITTYLLIGVLCTALGSKGTFWFNDHKDIGWAAYVLGLILMFVCAPYYAVCGIVEGVQEIVK